MQSPILLTQRVKHLRESFRRGNTRAACLALAALAGSLVAQNHAQNDAQDNAKDLLTRGAASIAAKPAEAVTLLRQAVRLDPELPGIHYELALAYHATGDEADAATEFREALARTPESAAAHNYLGIALFNLGEVQSALEEFRAAVRLAPKDSNAHFNLGEALARTGEPQAAVAELRIATGLAPSDDGLTRLLQRVETELAPSSDIHVEVRQVLVPVVVTDRSGHRIPGLTQSDFRLFEDGVEQKLTGFAAESADEPEIAFVEGNAAARASTRSQPGAAPVKPKRTYMVVIDSLHTQSAGLGAAREALEQIFERERSSDSQYVVVALGASAEVVVNVTSDPSAVRAAFDPKRFQKILTGSRVGSLQPEMDRFRRDLTETRYACDLAPTDGVYKAKCASGVERTSDRVQQIASLEQTLTTGFLRQLGSLVAQLAHARDRRTIILISDGFSIEPGREAASLFNAYFPPASHCFLPPDMLCPRDMVQSFGRMSDDFEPILKLAAGANITIDTIDSRGLHGPKGFDVTDSGVSPSVDGAVTRAARDAASSHGSTLAEIAAATGGSAYADSNNLRGGLERAFADGRDYYTLSYISTNPNLDGKFRAIAVQVRAPGSVVTAKRGYWAQ